MKLISPIRAHLSNKYGAIALAVLLLVIAVSSIAISWGRSSHSNDVDTIHIAVAAPISGSRSAAGKEMVQSIRLYLDSVNQEDGINGHPLELLVFDDQGDPTTALQVPSQVERSPALVLLGHLSSPLSIATAPIYKALQIPAITGTSTEDYITQANPYYFRTIFTNSVQGSVDALYAQQALNYKTASIIYSDDRLGQSFKEAFEETFKRQGTIKHSWAFDPQLKDLKPTTHAIVGELAAAPNAGIVFLAMDDVYAKDFIVALRRRNDKIPLMGTQTLARETFPKLFETEVEEKQQPGYFINGIYVSTSTIFDSAGVDAQEFSNAYKEAYGNSPTYVGAAYYDAARIAVRSIQAADIKNTPTTKNTPASYKEDRQKIRDRLEQVNRRDMALKGLNGPIYFDVTHDNTPPVCIGQFVGRSLLSAPVQFSPITNLSLVNLDRELKAGNIFHFVYKLKDQYFWRQEVVYTGIDVNKISQIDQKKSSFTADFYLWMRYVGNIDPANIQFPDVITDGESQNLSVFDWKKPLRSKVIDGSNYRLYRVHGNFKGSFDFRNYPFDRQKLRVYFQNTQIPSDRLVYAIDTFGLPSQRTTTDEGRYSSSLWQFRGIQYARETVSTTSTEGDPRLFNANNRIDYSGLSATIAVQRLPLAVLAKTALPLLLLAVVPLMTMYFSEKIVKEKAAITVAAVTAGTLLLANTYRTLPEVGYTVRIEYLFYAFFGSSLFAIWVAIVSDHLNLNGYKLVSKRLERAARVLYVAAILGVGYWIAFGKG